MSYLTALNRTVEEYESYYGILGYHKVYVGKKGSYKRYNRVNRFYHVPVVKLTQSTKLLIFYKRETCPRNKVNNSGIYITVFFTIKSYF